ncbi:MAG: transketolase C-terminal domain-containing protein [Janthinobacterium lividum]
MPVPAIHPDDNQYEPGGSITVHDGDDVAIISNGTVLWRALAAAEQLATENISARVISMPAVRPLDTHAIVKAAHETRGIVTAEEPPASAASAAPSPRPSSPSTHPGHHSRLRHLPTHRPRQLPHRPPGMSPNGIADAARALAS